MTTVRNRPSVGFAQSQGCRVLCSLKILYFLQMQSLLKGKQNASAKRRISVQLQRVWLQWEALMRHRRSLSAWHRSFPLEQSSALCLRIPSRSLQRQYDVVNLVSLDTEKHAWKHWYSL